MKTPKTILTATALVVCFLSHAQWTSDPLNPQLVSNVAWNQNGVQQVPDGSGGTFVYWLDSRVNGYVDTDIYGQHYNAEGVPQWEANGRLIVNPLLGYTFFNVMRSESDGEMILGWCDNNDSLKFQKLDNQGAKLWANDLCVARKVSCAPPTYVLGIASFRFMRDGLGYCVATEVVYCGGANGHRITRFTSDGVLTGWFNGEPEGSQYYSGAWGIDKTNDGTNEEYLFYTDGNGAGAHARVMRVSLAGDTVWGPLDALAGTNGLNYFYDAKSDDNGIAVLFQSTGPQGYTDLFMRKLNPDGTWAWGGSTTIVCGADGTQTLPHWQQDEEFYYVCWADSRPGTNPGNYDVYAQKIDKNTGAIQWAVDGIAVFSQSNYAPYPECVVTTDGEMIVCSEASIGYGGFNAQKINPDGTLAWSPSVLIDNALYLPFYSDYHLIISDTNVIVAWAETNPYGGADGIYISRFNELPSACPEDLNDDGVINTADLLLFMSSFGCTVNCGDADLSGDGVVNTSDLLLFMSAFGGVCP